MGARPRQTPADPGNLQAAVDKMEEDGEDAAPAPAPAPKLVSVVDAKVKATQLRLVNLHMMR